MRSPLSVVALLALLAAASAVRSDAASAGPAEPALVYVGMNDRDQPFLDYEGGGMVIESRVRQAERGDPFELELVVIDLDPSREAYMIGMDVEDRVETRLRAKVVRKGEAAFHLRGSLETRGPTRIQFVQMQRAGDSETFPELTFEAGRHPVAFDANVVGWLEP